MLGFHADPSKNQNKVNKFKATSEELSLNLLARIASHSTLSYVLRLALNLIL